MIIFEHIDMLNLVFGVYMIPKEIPMTRKLSMDVYTAGSRLMSSKGHSCRLDSQLTISYLILSVETLEYNTRANSVLASVKIDTDVEQAVLYNFNGLVHTVCRILR